jgi:hypothetical protein
MPAGQSLVLLQQQPTTTIIPRQFGLLTDKAVFFLVIGKLNP